MTNTLNYMIRWTTFVLFVCVVQLPYAQKTPEQTIRQILNDQATAWNEGNIDKFMETYWQSDDLQFLSGDGLTQGWTSTLERYKQRYPDQQAMGHLHFDLLSVNKRSSKVYSVIGQYHLTRQGLENLNGFFMLLVQKIKGKWRIAADSTH